MSLLREPDAGNPPVRFDERDVETEHAVPPRHASTLLARHPDEYRQWAAALDSLEDPQNAYEKALSSENDDQWSSEYLAWLKQHQQRWSVEGSENFGCDYTDEHTFTAFSSGPNAFVRLLTKPLTTSLSTSVSLTGKDAVFAIVIGLTTTTNGAVDQSFSVEQDGSVTIWCADPNAEGQKQYPWLSSLTIPNVHIKNPREFRVRVQRTEDEASIFIDDALVLKSHLPWDVRMGFTLWNGKATLRSVEASARPKDEVFNAIQRLASAKNYSWKFSMSANGAERPPIEGKTQKNGYTMTSASDNSSAQAVRKGTRTLLWHEGRWQDVNDWKTAFDVVTASTSRPTTRPLVATHSSTRFADTMPSTRPGAPQMVTLMLLINPTPVAEAAKLFPQLTDVKKVGDHYEGMIAGVDSMPAAMPLRLSGSTSVRFWIEDEILTRLEVKMIAKIGGRNPRLVENYRTYEITGVGSTKVEVPEEARKRLP